MSRLLFNNVFAIERHNTKLEEKGFNTHVSIFQINKLVINWTLISQITTMAPSTLHTLQKCFTCANELTCIQVPAQGNMMEFHTL